MAKTPQLTPLMQQYWDVKNAHPDKILLFRMGDFFEMFHQDAETAAPLLNIALTQRNKKSGDQTPMCGVPHHSIAEKINRLLSHGFKVAICDQIEDPKLAKGLVKRAVTRVLSPGMVYDPDTLAGDSNHFLCAFEQNHLAFLDATTGESFYYEIEGQNQFQALLDLLRPVEIVLTTKQSEVFEPPLKMVVSVFEELRTQEDEPLACQRLRSYALSMQGERIADLIGKFERRVYLGRMKLSATVLKHLEIFETYQGENRGSLFHTLQRTKTSGGARLLKSWLMFPLVTSELIRERQERIMYWLKAKTSMEAVRSQLAVLGDLERRWGKLTQPQFSPQDLKSLADSLEVALALDKLHPIEGIQEEHRLWAKNWHSEITDFLADEIPVQFKNGQFVRLGYQSDLDEWIRLAVNSQELILKLESKEREQTGINSLKIRYNNVFGFYIEVTNAHKSRVPTDRYQRKQTLTNAERYTTEELQELERKVLQARTRRVEIELELFEEMKQKILKGLPLLRDWARALSTLDVLTSLAWLALEQNYVCPDFSSENEGLTIRLGRHPVVEQSLSRSVFIGNDFTLKPGEGLIITGPNMAGKSTYMRQVALICLMAQIGSFVPAESAKLHVLENIFTRVGSSDSLTEGLSTFMVEMKETAEMLRGAGPRSLVILDEVGRGTSTYDGLSLAQSILEYLVDHTKAYTLFATHYHELTQLPLTKPCLKNVHMTVHESHRDIKFLYSVKPGAAQKSFGIQVAELAGLPQVVTKRARTLLRGFESIKTEDPSQLMLIEAPEEVDSREKEALRHVRNLALNELTPIDALNELDRLKRSLDEELNASKT